MYGPWGEQLNVFNCSVVDYRLELHHVQSINIGYHGSNVCMHEVKNENDTNYEIILINTHHDQDAALLWLRLSINKNYCGTKHECVLQIDEIKTEQLRSSLKKCNLSLDATEFDSTMCKHYIILFERRKNHSIVYFDFVAMKWYQSLQVECQIASFCFLIAFWYAVIFIAIIYAIF